jgi:hypothetical protein
VVSRGGGLWCLRERVRVRFPGRMDWTYGVLAMNADGPPAARRGWSERARGARGAREDKGERGAQVEDGDAEAPR